MPQKNISLPAWLYLLIAVLTLFDAFIQAPFLALLTSVLIIAFVILEFKSIPLAQKISGGGLILIGLIGASQSGNSINILFDGIERSRIFLLLFFAVSWLEQTVSLSPALKATRKTIISQPPGRRYLYLAYGVHFIGSVLNLAGLSLLANTMKNQKDIILRNRMARAVINGFGSASSWSPFFVGMIVVLNALPSLNWYDIGPFGMLLAFATISCGWAYDRLILRTSKFSNEEISPVPLSRKNFCRMAGIILSLIGLALLIVEATGTSIPVTLGLLAPPFGLIWYTIINKDKNSLAYGAKEFTFNVLTKLPTLRNEVIVFVAANIFGVGIASIVPTDNLSNTINTFLPWVDTRIFAIIFLFLLASAIGFHPVITIIALTSILPPETLGLSDWVIGLTYAGVWGLSAMISPFSGTTLLVSRIIGVPAHVIGWRWMLPTSILNGFSIALIVIILRHLLG